MKFGKAEKTIDFFKIIAYNIVTGRICALYTRIIELTLKRHVMASTVGKSPSGDFLF